LDAKTAVTQRAEDSADEADGDEVAGESRGQFWIEDVFAALNSVYTGLQETGACPPEAVQEKVKAICYRIAFEFAWTGRVTVNGHNHTNWSSLRDVLKQRALDSHTQFKVSSSDPDGIAGILLSSLGRLRQAADVNSNAASHAAAVSSSLADISVDLSAFLTVNNPKMPAKVYGLLWLTKFPFDVYVCGRPAMSPQRCGCRATVVCQVCHSSIRVCTACVISVPWQT
jgi:hypothetical protein